MFVDLFSVLCTVTFLKDLKEFCFFADICVNFSAWSLRTRAFNHKSSLKIILVVLRMPCKTLVHVDINYTQIP